MRAMTLVILALLLASFVLPGTGPAAMAAQEATPASGTTDECPATTPEENAELVRRWYEEVLTARDVDLVAELLAADYSRSVAGKPYRNEPGADDDVQFVQVIMSEFPDLEFAVEDILADGDMVAVRTIATGTHTGEALVDHGGVAATGRPMARENIAIWRVACGKLAEQWIVQDNLGMLRQLGVITDDELADAGEPTVATPTP